ncbi:hypothetical protein [Aquimarina litoralis]|uniref:hypothetical protein n=1 Tax=Aquimarina litoralis TaxID=584605 RepID=UPI001C55C706|nr:hypothetical protein [Aquimarina litoralis]MBW1295145.1 hypothetical protein [Aquimarina litoralis]
MGKYKDAEWYIKSSTALIEKYGDVPPPWIYAPNSHPYSIGWRMGGGESHIMILNEWLDQQDLSFDERIIYLKKYPAPARWYSWIIHFLWDVDSYKFEAPDYIPYFEKLAGLGFKNTKDFHEDFSREDLD